MNSPIINNFSFELKEKLAALQAALLSMHPTIPVLLREIHSKLKADPEIVTLMNDEDKAIIVSGLKRQTATALVVSVAKTMRVKSKSFTENDI